MDGRKTMEELLEEMRIQIECHTDDAVSLISKNGITPKQHGYLCENIFVIDLNSKEDFEQTKTLMHELQNTNDAIVEVKTFGKPKRITLHF
jgi:N-acetylglucosamine kinase-like BadF-type ATPase